MHTHKCIYNSDTFGEEHEQRDNKKDFEEQFRKWGKVKRIRHVQSNQPT